LFSNKLQIHDSDILLFNPWNPRALFITFCVTKYHEGFPSEKYFDLLNKIKDNNIYFNFNPDSLFFVALLVARFIGEFHYWHIVADRKKTIDPVPG
jgi:hypothetical protein